MCFHNTNTRISRKENLEEKTISKQTSLSLSQSLSFSSFLRCLHKTHLCANTHFWLLLLLVQLGKKNLVFIIDLCCNNPSFFLSFFLSSHFSFSLYICLFSLLLLFPHHNDNMTPIFSWVCNPLSSFFHQFQVWVNALSSQESLVPKSYNCQSLVWEYFSPLESCKCFILSLSLSVLIGIKRIKREREGAKNRDEEWEKRERDVFDWIYAYEKFATRKSYSWV